MLLSQYTGVHMLQLSVFLLQLRRVHKLQLSGLILQLSGGLSEQNGQQCTHRVSVPGPAVYFAAKGNSLSQITPSQSAELSHRAYPPHIPPDSATVRVSEPQETLHCLQTDPSPSQCCSLAVNTTQRHGNADSCSLVSKSYDALSYLTVPQYVSETVKLFIP
jgi:hypothetical protein